MRGFRPSYFQTHNDRGLGDSGREKMENLQRYIVKAAEGQPLFDEAKSLQVSQTMRNLRSS